MFRGNTKKAFSLLEMLLYTVLIVIIGGLALTFIFQMINGFNKTKIKREVLSNARLAMGRMVADIKSAHSVYIPTSVLGIHPGHISMETLVKLPQGEKRTYFDYYVSSSRLYFKQDGQGPIAITSESVIVDSLIFKYFKDGTSSAETIQIDLVVKSLPSVREDKSATINLTSGATVRGNYQ